ncbi:cyclophilin-like fold protein [Pectobacterium brasiliense]|uniref:Cyclophilin-like fold protein n=1 Tax=Pectobacterium brasiliense TaxID=180957 RepID=A0AAW9H8J1_9GAMM|nr:cyclophilin-like fold protein [Pectobacterium brasiliense]MDY4380290.1 cyclophilin-like fold protein [Pectobacterium brasiliense]
MLKPIVLALVSLTAVSFSLMSVEAEGIKVKITAGDQMMTATFYDNATTRALVSRFPLTLPMEDLYGREMCYRFADALPANEAQTSGYEVGDIVYWAPRNSFVIMYEQNNERISNLQKIGRIHSGVGIFKHTGNIDVKFELAN